MAFCTLVGWVLAGKYRKKRDYFKDLYSFNENFLSELTFRRRPLPEFLSTLAPQRDFFEDLSAYLREEERMKRGYLTKEEISYAETYFSSLGTADAAAQLSYYSGERAEAEKRMQESELLAKRNSELYLKLGFLGGLALLILLV